MRSKTILSIAAFIIAFGFSVFLASVFITKPLYESGLTSHFGNNFQSAEARSISALLRQDVSKGRERDRNLYQLKVGVCTPYGQPEFENYVVIIDEYVNFSSNLDATGLPYDFRDAWERHMKVWQDYAEFLNDSRDLDVDSSERILRIENKYNKEIDATWYEVVRIGRKYGAKAN